jgi:hypothetical protein
MNIPEWRNALAAAGLLPQFDDVLDGFANGFHQGIPEHRIGVLRWFTPPNHLSAMLTKPKIEKSIKDKLMQGRMFGPFTEEEVARRFEFFRTSPLGAVVKGDGSVRPINDLLFPQKSGSIRSVNSFVDKEDFATMWDDFQRVASFFQTQTKPCLLALFDWEKAYCQIPTHPSQWPYLMTMDFDGRFLLDTRISFGGVAGCGAFGRPADVWKLVMLHKFRLTTIFCWVDDNLFIKEVGDETNMLDIVKRSTELGVMTNKEKYSPFKEEQKLIGFIWNRTNRTVRLPPSKLEQRRAQVGTFLVHGAKFSLDDVEVMVGRLNHVTYLFPQMKCNLCGLYQWLKRTTFSTKLANRYTARIFLLATNKSINLRTEKIKSPFPIASSITDAWSNLLKQALNQTVQLNPIFLWTTPTEKMRRSSQFLVGDHCYHSSYQSSPVCILICLHLYLTITRPLY